jgi:hypothetical protein
MVAPSCEKHKDMTKAVRPDAVRECILVMLDALRGISGELKAFLSGFARHGEVGGRIWETALMLRIVRQYCEMSSSWFGRGN